MAEVRVRFAPSPTGYLHIGGLRTALYDYIFAKNQGGKYILRIEDTDRTRYVEGAIENLIESLLWAGVVHDEGVFIENGKLVQKGEYGPYIQSERLDIYKKYVDELIEKGHAYYCFCSKERLDKIREEQKSKGLTPRYDGHCRDITIEEAKKRIEAGEEYTVRLKLPPNKDIKFKDLIRGEITINTNDLDDQVLLKSDGFPTYHLAVVVDDHLMKITHIVRGEEWLSSTPKHSFLYEVFGWEQPVYVHLPTVLNKNKKKLSKRHGDVAVGDFRKKGYLPEALVNYLALVGWSPEDNREILSMEELINEFSFDRVSKTGGVFDIDKLNWINGQYIRKSDVDRITKLAIPHLVEAGFINEDDVKNRYEWIKMIVSALQEKISYISEIVDKAEIFFKDKVEPENEEVVEVLKGEHVSGLIEAFEEELNSIDEIDEEFASSLFKKLQKKTGAKGKNLYMPIRAILTGQLHGPDLVKTILILGKQNILKRIEYVKKEII
ncbi:nondiscriminating glutamyl-tRNA synthetase [Caloranaerobacter azorensis DSM 13643]|uniref:Glutamate--tRNA ligase n=1 Tax=Caloranaerobacter azorensis DSM 13643 TaxID=1121264 RepID=A0A1M5WR69_9FIRM|nr:glutamate--tRNA ligase [Caloranaerobacter azorensis]SHH90106.1 nondiscriminating glutamyl-tRNA synthetase [Caloranaerobacter azorensis DSM 13643]